MIRLFLFSLRNRWFEYVAAAAVVALAVSALVVQGSLATSAEKQVHDLAHHLGKNMLIVPEDTNLANFYALEYDDHTLPDDYPNRLMNSPLAQHVRGIQSTLFGNVVVGNTPLVIAGQPKLSQAMRWKSIPDAPAVALGDSAARSLGLKINDTLQVEGQKLTVVEIARSLPDGLDMAMFTDLTLAQKILNKPGEINAINMGGCWCSIDVPALAAKVELELPNTKAITVAGVLKSQQGTISTVKRYSKVLFLIAVLLIGGITVVLTTAQLRRQKREIGLLLAIGAPSWSITMLFVGMAGLIGLVGSLAGFALGGPMTQWVAEKFMGSPLPASPDVFVTVFLTALLASLVAALLPALHSTRIDPTTTLREI
jgi:ABC-type lipoprotein release transport system permease subunit